MTLGMHNTGLLRGDQAWHRDAQYIAVAPIQTRPPPHH
jgi:hypothetical protein